MPKKKLTQNEIKQKIKKNSNGKIIVLGEYKGFKNKLKVQCKKCKRIWEIKFNSLIRKTICRNCNHHNKKNHEEFLNTLQKKITKSFILIWH